MSCPQIYIGTGRSTRPLADDSANDSVVPPADLQAGTIGVVQITV